jgi:DNA-binding transcriptional LysR family regulator
MASLSDLTLRELELFVIAARSRSLRETARQSGLLPAHVSKLMQRLEEKMGQTLFRRSSAGILPTPEGLSLLGPAAEICEISETLAGNTRKPAVKESLWTLGSISFLTTYLLAPHVESWRRNSRNARFRLIEFTHNDLVAHGLKGAFDLAVHIEKLEWTKAWETFSLGGLRWKLYARQNHPLPESCSEGEVSEYSFIVPTDWSENGYTIGSDFCPLTVRQRRKGDEVATAETALELCRFSDQLTFVPEILAKNWGRMDQMKEIRVVNWPVVEKQIYLSVRSDRVSRRLVDLIVRSIKQV